ncbi:MULTISPECIES: hypothetical protein [unclassified Paenibacillus]|uniref:hypothetical protein n=1 Tax=unclassified Paenibacillus TaxID=185978 RepID=UPI002406FE3D|nr:MULTISPECIES: hypothetical protein [unclassified Paenibacillus]MDF9845568.1 hypothetical protein [Paenibacillus sp. PastF-2]MDF9845586.1 hypothetical protein [Paenibacillus sp. PastF-2]MDF9852143.1 hypothetical protein [Paenibacillus sp. PastM-2]MDF9852156.1 hypothetical protein [Paenibacillus sp. PastM-2]MDF9858717.1 hypothetical protein [Paenibacillus sp. PastF-1]
MADKEGPRKLRKLAAAFSSAYFSPIPYWLGMPIKELYEWVDTANELTEERNRQRKG